MSKKKRYKKLWVYLREQLTKQENTAKEYSSEREALHKMLTLMAEMEAAEFLED